MSRHRWLQDAAQRPGPGMALQAGAIFAVALTLRLIVIAQLSDVPLFRTPQLDSLEYLNWAEQLASRDFSWPPTPIHGPGYPMVLGAILAVVRSLAAARIIQAILGSFTAVFVFLIALRFHGPRAGVIAGLLAAAYAPLILIDVSIFGEGLLVLLLAVSVYVVSSGERTIFRSMIAGLAFGFAATVRPTALILTPLFLRRTKFLLFAAMAAYPILPVMFHHWSATGDVVAVQTSGGFNLYLGNSPKHDGTAWARPGGEWDWARGAAWRAGIREGANEDPFFIAETVREIRQDPAGFVRLLGVKALWLIQADEIRDSHSFTFFSAHSSLLRWLPGFGIAFALGMAGIIATVRERAHSWMILGWLVLMPAALLLLVIGMRYRMPLVPPLIIMAGAGADAMLRAFEARQHRALAALLAAMIVAFAAAHARRHDATHDVTEERALNALALMKERNLPAARAAAMDAAHSNPRNSLAWLTLGDVEAARGAWREAEDAWRRAIAADRRTARAWSHLAYAFMRRGDRDNAERALQRALDIKEDEEAVANMQRLRTGSPARPVTPVAGP